MMNVFILLKLNDENSPSQFMVEVPELSLVKDIGEAIVKHKTEVDIKSLEFYAADVNVFKTIINNKTNKTIVEEEIASMRSLAISRDVTSNGHYICKGTLLPGQHNHSIN